MRSIFDVATTFSDLFSGFWPGSIMSHADLSSDGEESMESSSEESMDESAQDSDEEAETTAEDSEEEEGDLQPATKSSIDCLPCRVLKPDDLPRMSQDSKTCIICMDDFEAGSMVRVLPCLHHFHTKCIDQWLMRQGTCPVCKHAVDDNDVGRTSDPRMGHASAAPRPIQARAARHNSGNRQRLVPRGRAPHGSARNRHRTPPPLLTRARNARARQERRAPTRHQRR